MIDRPPPTAAGTPAPLVRIGALVAVIVAATSFGTAWAGPLVRVLLAEGLETALIELAVGHEVRTVRGALHAGAGLDWPLRVRGEDLVSGELTVGPWLELHPEDEVVRYEGGTYRGGLRIEAHEGGLRVVNLVDLEAYLRGVVPSEMQAIWPLEALKAQAVAARSYSLASLDRDAAYDICASDACQVYRGVAAEHARSDRAVRETEGIVIAWNGAPATAYYHADSGGALASSGEVWGRAMPYLRTRSDVPVVSPHRGWTARLDPATLASALAEEGSSVGVPSALTVLERSASGRVLRAELAGSAGTVVVQGPALTRVLRSAGLKSTRIVPTGPLTVRGDGWGHGVGMSQYGARALAIQGYDYARILGYYYPGVGLQRRIYRSDAP